jgi:hypothetical protein
MKEGKLMASGVSNQRLFCLSGRGFGLSFFFLGRLCAPARHTALDARPRSACFVHSGATLPARTAHAPLNHRQAIRFKSILDELAPNRFTFIQRERYLNLLTWTNTLNTKLVEMYTSFRLTGLLRGVE